MDPSPPGSPPQNLASLSQHMAEFGAQEAPLNPGPSQGICQSPLTFSRRERSVFKGSALGMAGLGLCCHDSIFLGSPRGCQEISEAKESTGQNLHYRISPTLQSTRGPSVDSPHLQVPSPQFGHPGGQQAWWTPAFMQSIHPRMTELPHGGLSLHPTQS